MGPRAEAPNLEEPGKNRGSLAFNDHRLRQTARGLFRSAPTFGLATPKGRRSRRGVVASISADDAHARDRGETMVTDFALADEATLQRFRAGDHITLESIYREYVSLVARLVARMLRRSGGEGRGGSWRTIAGDLPDLVQDVFARAFEAETRRRFDGVRPYGPYLGQIARNVVIDHLRRTQKHVVLVEVNLNDEMLASSVGTTEIDDYADLRTMSMVNSYLARLPAELRQVHDALYIRGLSQREAAEFLGLGRQVVRTLESRLREGLRKELAQMSPFRARQDDPGALRAISPGNGKGR